MMTGSKDTLKDGKKLEEQIRAQVNANVRGFNLMEQALMLTKDTPGLLDKYEGKVVVYYDHNVIASGDSEGDACRNLTAEQRGLPIVIRRLVRNPNDYKGGSKS